MSEEPKFTLRAQDKFAPQIIERWADEVEAATRNTIGDTAERSRQKVKEARALAYTMRAWQVLNRSKIPD